MAAVVDERLAQTFVELADTLVGGFDLMEFLHMLTERCVELLDASAAGLLLADGRGALRLVAASTEQARLAELFQIQNDEGPCLDCFRSGAAVIVSDISSPDAAARWPSFSAQAREMGFAAVHAIPMRLRDQVIGTLNLFSSTAGGGTGGQGACRRGDHRHFAGARDSRAGHGGRPAAGGPEQPGDHRTGQGRPV